MTARHAFWQDKRVLVTGHTGFKGAWLCHWLIHQGAHVTGYGLPAPTEPSLFELSGLSGEMDSISGDVTDLLHLKRVVHDSRPQVIVHMAAQALVLPAYDDPVTTYRTNVIGTVNVLEAARHADDLRVLINVTSDKCYENTGRLQGYQETDPLGGRDPYSSSKACAELVTAAYRASYFEGPDACAIATVRSGNVIGGGDWASDRLVPDLMRAWLNHQPAVLRNPLAVRPWQHVLDPLHGYLMLAERLWVDGTLAGAWNFGPDAAAPVTAQKLAETLQRHWPHAPGLQQATVAGPYEAAVLSLDCRRAHTALGWQPVLDLDTALAWVAAWYQAYQRQEDLRAVTRAQIQAFEQRVVQAAAR